MAKKVTRIVIIDDHPAVRDGLAARIAIERDMEVCGEAGDVGDALKVIDQTEPDVAVVDISLKTGSGLDLIKRVKSRNDAVHILVWSMFEENLYADRALRAGAMGYINKEASTDQIVEAIRDVRSGKIHLSAEMADEMLHRVVMGKEGVRNSPLEELSDRELEVFQHLGHGLTTQQVAHKMRLSPTTIETYRARIKDKLDIATTTDLTRQATQWVLENC